MLFSTSNSYAQVSYEFIEALPPETSSVSFVDLPYFGVYKADSSAITFEFNSTGVFTRNLIIQSISRKTIRESSQFEVRGNYLFGIAENDSLPCVLEDENYYFGIVRRDTIIGSTSKNQLKKINASTYMLNFIENGSFTPCLIQFDGSALSIRYFDYATDTQIFSKIKSQQSKIEEQMTYVYLLPNLKEWKKINQAQLFGESKVFQKQAK